MATLSRSKAVPIYDGPVTIVLGDGNISVVAQLHTQPTPPSEPLRWVGTLYADAADDLAWRMSRHGLFTLVMPAGREGLASVLDHRVGRCSHVVQIQGTGEPPF
jgi:hypothetical protein